METHLQLSRNISPKPLFFNVIVQIHSCIPVIRAKRIEYTSSTFFPFPPTDSAGTANACSTNNGGCAHLCLPRPGNEKTCACTTGFIMSPDGTRCEQYESYAVVSTNKYIRGFHVNSSDHSEAMVPVSGCMLDDV